MGNARFQAIEAAAYQLWLEAGCPQGCAEAHWLAAERQVTQTEAMAGLRLALHVSPSLRGRSILATTVPARRAAPSTVKAVA